jgi:aminoglycoside/choline kinase family phosphotransferase
MVANERGEGAPELPVPECYGGDREAGLVVMADLGDGDSMAEVLLRDPAVAGPEATDAAVRSFEGYIDAIAALHLATFGTGDRYRAFRTDFGPPPNDPLAPSTLLDGWRELGVHLDVVLDAAVEAEVAAVEALLAAPGAWEVLSLKDLCPDNNRVLPGGEVRLFDAQYSGLHHGLIDVAYLHTTMPTCWCVRRLPDGLADRLVERYVDRLRAAGHDPGDPLTFARELAMCRVYMALWRGGGAARHAPSQDGDAQPYWDAYEFSMVSHRQQLAFRTRQLAEAAALRPDLAALHAWAERLHQTVVRTWPSAEPLPLYPAFG